MVTYEEIHKDDVINSLVSNADKCLDIIGFTKHDKAHSIFVVNRIEYILSNLGYSEQVIDHAKIAGYTHDVGNCINRTNHDISSAQIMFNMLLNKGMPVNDVVNISNAIGCHDSLRGMNNCSEIASALIIADKSDVRRSRVRIKDLELEDIHDRVNYATYKTALEVKGNVILLTVYIDSNYCSKLDFYSIFMDRMNMCRVAAKALGCEFDLCIKEENCE